MTQEQRLRLKIVDDREPPEIREKLLEIGWNQKRLFSADYFFQTGEFLKVGIERKSVDDFCSSLDGRMARELEELIEHYDLRILLLEGSWKRAYDNKMISTRGVEYFTWTLAWNFIRTWQDKGITVELTTSLGHTIKRLNELYAYYQKTAHTGGLTKKAVGDSRILALACGGIGIKLGEALLAKFGSLKRIANATAEEFATVEKVGSKKAENLWQHFNRGEFNGKVEMNGDEMDEYAKTLGRMI